MECARRDEKKKKKAFTLYPCSARVAHAEPPARPVPTTMMSIFLLFAGLTNLTLFLWLLHFKWSGPLGTFESNADIFFRGFNSFINECRSMDLFLIILFFGWNRQNYILK